ncbi:hypothetical protein GBAR_LOCUS18200, partial [Geodia barretti]
MASVFQGLWRLPLSLGSRRAPQVVVLRGLSGATSDSVSFVDGAIYGGDWVLAMSVSI